MRGAFIVVEGLDRSGKTTQVANLQAKLESSGTPVKLFKFPDRTTAIGQMIDSYLRSQSELDDQAIHLLFSANRWELATSIESLLEQGTTVVCDRYAFSGVAFSAAKGLPLEWCRAPDSGLPAPDLTIFFDISPEAARARGGYGEERYEKEQLQRRVRELFDVLASEFDDERWVTVDAGRSKEEVAGEVWKYAAALVGKVSPQVDKLWVPALQGRIMYSMKL
ncbi:Thymidylate kinase [Mycena indigotica]|uniref:Thymidylate kinase n=1 Tax=Mycena indigotica TaxID=2126181 RepID=A0A8H6SNQ6_9AGAR|nr:Thymidylate kinase [Mycena indigotica]KAF7302220.1 Thymidylate kinase [Mycena indigotica]